MVAIMNCIAKKVGPALEGETPQQYAVSQMLLIEGDDLLREAVKAQKGDRAEYDEFWDTALPAHLVRLEAMLGGAPGVPNAARGSWTPGTSVGELNLFASLQQLVQVKGSVLDATPRLKTFHSRIASDPRTKKVLAGKSALGSMRQYFTSRL